MAELLATHVWPVAEHIEGFVAVWLTLKDGKHLVLHVHSRVRRVLTKEGDQ